MGSEPFKPQLVFEIEIELEIVDTADLLIGCFQILCQYEHVIFISFGNSRFTYQLSQLNLNLERKLRLTESTVGNVSCRVSNVKLTCLVNVYISVLKEA